MADEIEKQDFRGRLTKNCEDHIQNILRYEYTEGEISKVVKGRYRKKVKMNETDRKAWIDAQKHFARS
jgi:hypothetical protein